MLGVSRTALREGLKALEGINVLTISPGKGTFINEDPDILVGSEALKISLERETIECIYEVRFVLGVGIAKYAAMKATKHDIAALEKTVDEMAEAAKRKPVDMDLVIKADEAFHLNLCMATQNKILEKMAWPIENHAMLRSWKKLKNFAELVGSAVNGHKRILRAVKRRDAKAAMDEMEKHLEMVLNTFRTLKD